MSDRQQSAIAAMPSRIEAFACMDGRSWKASARPARWRISGLRGMICPISNPSGTDLAACYLPVYPDCHCRDHRLLSVLLLVASRWRVVGARSFTCHIDCLCMVADAAPGCHRQSLCRLRRCLCGDLGPMAQRGGPKFAIGYRVGGAGAGAGWHGSYGIRLVHFR